MGEQFAVTRNQAIQHKRGSLVEKSAILDQLVEPTG